VPVPVTQMCVPWTRTCYLNSAPAEEIPGTKPNSNSDEFISKNRATNPILSCVVVPARAWVLLKAGTKDQWSDTKDFDR
jgi:hypothetical protein